MKKSFKKVLSALLVAVMLLLTSIPAVNLTLTASAATNGKTQSQAVEWANSKVGQSLDYDGAYGAQCVDLICFYYSFLGNTSPGGNANKYASNSLPSGWQRIQYYSGFVPQAGDIAVWTYASSSLGHVAIITSADSSRMYVVEQNGSTGVTKSSSYSYSYGTFYGVIRPDFCITSDTTAPTISSPSVSCKTENQFNINAELYDENGIKNAWIVVYGPGGEYQFSANASNGTFYYTIYTSDFGGPGTYTLHLYVFDYAGNSSKYVYENIQAVKDTTAPKVSEPFISCKSDASFNINATIFDENGIDHAWIVVYGPSGEYQYSEKASNGFFYHTIYTADHGGPGEYAVHLYIIDPSGNSTKVVYDNIMAVKDSEIPHDGSITANRTVVPIGETVTFNYSISGANNKYLGIDYAGGNRYATQEVFSDSGSTTYTFTQPGKYCCIIEGSNTLGYNCSPGVFVTVFDPNISISFDANGGICSTGNKTVTYGSKYGDLPVPTKNGYTFDGWFTENVGGTEIKSSDVVEIIKSTTLYAHWTKISDAKATVKAVGIEHNVTINYKSNYVLTPEIVADPEAEYTVEYKSSDDSVVKVDQNGKLYGAKKGNATITCTVTDSFGNVVTDECNVNIDYSTGQWMIIIFLFGWIWYI